MTVQSLKSATSLRLIQKIPPDKLSFFFCLQPNGWHCHEGMALRADCCGAAIPEQDSFVWLPPNVALAEILIDRTHHRSVLGKYADETGARGFGLFRAQAASLQVLRACTARLLGEPGTLAGGDREALAQSVLAAVRFCIANAAALEPPRSLLRRRAVLRAFRERMEADDGDAVRLTDLCAALGTKSRTFGMICEKAVGYGPMRLLRLRRFALAHQALRAGLGRSVTEIALDHGFNELGRFASEYRRLFGECPSATFRGGVGAVVPTLPEPRRFVS